MDSDGHPPITQSFVAKNAQVRNVAGGYHDYSTTTKVKNIQVSNSGRHEMEALLKHVTHGALHDSAERGPDAPKCHPETRIAVQRDIMSWIGHGEQDDVPKRILWLSGPAGSGKTAIAGTIADECHKKGMLAASFFLSAFARSIDRRLSRNVVSTLAYSLLQHKSIIGLKEQVLSVIEDDPMVFERHLDRQLEVLILNPLRKVAGHSDRRHWPQVILVDGLDECEGHSESDVGNPTSKMDAQKEILCALSRACADLAFPFRIIIASRPEPVIRHFFFDSPSPVLNVFLDDKYDPDADIRLFLEAMFSNIRRRFNLPSTWAPKDVIDLLVEEASGQFIYAATVVRFVDSPALGSPQQQLIRLLEWRHLDDSKPFASLDALYSRILRTSPEPLSAAKWIRVVDRYGHLSAFYNKNLLESYSGELEHVLGSLTSLIGLVDERGEPVFHIYHKSLLDFLWDPHRSSDLHVSEETLTHLVQDRYYQVLQDRGPQSNSDPSTNPPPPDFLKIFCGRLERCMDPHRRYTLGDVEWWVANLVEDNRRVDVPEMFASIHRQCKWYHCLPACGVWRKGILQHCREQGWRVPTPKETLHDRLKKFKFNWTSLQDYPLRLDTTEPTTAESSRSIPPSP